MIWVYVIAQWHAAKKIKRPSLYVYDRPTTEEKPKTKLQNQERPPKINMKHKILIWLTLVVLFPTICVLALFRFCDFYIFDQDGIRLMIETKLMQYKAQNTRWDDKNILFNKVKDICIHSFWQIFRHDMCLLWIITS